MEKRKPGAAGFSLVEVLVAALILMVAIAGLLSAFPVGHRDIVYSGRVSQAVELAQQKLEELKSGTYPAADGSADGTQTNGAYTISWTVTNVGFAGSVDDLRKVDVTVSWAQMARPGSYELAAFISKPY